MQVVRLAYGWPMFAYSGARESREVLWLGGLHHRWHQGGAPARRVGGSTLGQRGRAGRVGVLAAFAWRNLSPLALQLNGMSKHQLRGRLEIIN